MESFIKSGQSISILFRMRRGWEVGDEGVTKRPTASFPSVTSTNVGISSKNYRDFVHWCKISRPYLAPVPNYRPSTKTTPQKKAYDNFSHRNGRVTKFWPCDHIYNVI